MENPYILMKKPIRRTWTKKVLYEPQNINIGNRTIIDNPSDYDLEVKRSPIHGYGLFTKIAFRKGQTICPYNHLPSQVISWKEFEEKYGKDYRYTYSLKAFGNRKIINCKETQNLVCFVNDDRPNENCYFRQRCLRAKRDIKAGEELTLCYPHYNPRDNI